MTASSSCEAEYIAALEATREAVWMMEFLTELGVVPSALASLADTGAIALAHEPHAHKNTKHIKR